MDREREGVSEEGADVDVEYNIVFLAQETRRAAAAEEEDDAIYIE